MREILTGLAYPLIVAASALYAGAHCLWRKHRVRGYRADPAVYPGSARHLVDLEVRVDREQHIARHAERIVDAELARIGELYEAPADGQTAH